jgi:hypothetical protein
MAISNPANKTRGSDSRSGNNRQSSDPEVTGTPSFAFHKQYVQDVSDIVNNVQERKEQLRFMKTRLTASKPDQVFRMVRVPAAGVMYVAPGAVKGSSYTQKTALVDLLRTLNLGSVDDMMLFVQDPPSIAHCATKFWVQELGKCKSSKSPQKTCT